MVLLLEKNVVVCYAVYDDNIASRQCSSSYYYCYVMMI